MSSRGMKLLMGMELFFLLIPLSGFTLLVAILSFIAYPLPEPEPIQVAFDFGVLITIGGIASAWYLTLVYLSCDSKGLRQASIAWMAVLWVAVFIGALCVLVALEQFLLADFPSERIGFTLLAPAIMLLPLGVHLLRARAR